MNLLQITTEVEWEAQIGACINGQHPPSRTPVDELPWTHQSEGNAQADRVVGKAPLTSGLHLGRSEVLKSLRHYLQAKKAKGIIP